MLMGGLRPILPQAAIAVGIYELVFAAGDYLPGMRP